MIPVIGQLWQDLRWALAMVLARRWRRDCSFSQRIVFDAAIRPSISDDRSVFIAYPDALYHANFDNLARAMKATGRPCRRDR